MNQYKSHGLGFRYMTLYKANGILTANVGKVGPQLITPARL